MNWQPVHASLETVQRKRRLSLARFDPDGRNGIDPMGPAASRGVKAVMGKRSPFVPTTT